MNTSLQHRTVLVIGRGSGIARAVALATRDAGAQVIAAGRNAEGNGSEAWTTSCPPRWPALAGGFPISPGTRSARPLIPRSSGRSCWPNTSGRASTRAAHSSCSPASRPSRSPGTLAVAITNGAADTLTRSLALELAPIRVNAISPGVIDTGAWDALGEKGKAEMFSDQSERNPARRIGTAVDIADAVLFAMTSTFLTGITLAVDGGEALT
jgi:NAD(P)-dependent dehydrogenase (short-subunit alcohol dehydrogenase family)